MNQVVISGNLTNDCTVNWYSNNSKAILGFNIGWNHTKKDEFGNYQKVPNFFSVKHFPKNADLAQKLTKGSFVVLSGELRQENWTDKDGNRKSNVVILANEVYLPEKMKNTDNSSTQTTIDLSNQKQDEDVPF